MSSGAGPYVSALVALAFLAALIWALWRVLVPRPGRSMVCTTCGHHGPTRAHTRGSLAIEIVLWLAFILPGLVYSLWRLSSRRQVCASCGAESILPADSPVGRRMLRGDK